MDHALPFSGHENCVWPDEVLECEFFPPFSTAMSTLPIGQNTCPTNYSSQMRFADASDCSQYAQCVDGHLERRICSNGFLFDRITKMCKPYDQAECHGSKPDSFLASATTNSPCQFVRPSRDARHIRICIQIGDRNHRPATRRPPERSERSHASINSAASVNTNPRPGMSRPWLYF